MAAGVAVVATLLLPVACNEVDATEIVDAEQLGALADDTGHDVYWAGERPETQIEWEQTGDRLIYVRYLPEEGEVDDELRKAALTIGTYPKDGAFAELQALAKQPRTFSQGLPGGGLVVVNRDQASSAYIAFPESDLEIEVYDPDPAVVLELATSGEVAPVPTE